MSAIAYVGLWLFVFSVPWDNLIIIPGVGVVTKITGGLAAALALLAAVAAGRFRRWHAFHLAALLFVLWTAGVLLFISHGVRPPRKLGTFVQLLIMVWMVWELAPSRQRLLGLMTAYVLGAYVTAFDTIRLYRTAGGALRRFAAGAFDPNDLAMILALALPMAWYLGMSYRQPLLRWLCRAFVPIGVLAIGLTGSRGAMITGVLALMVIPLTMTRLSPGRLATALLLLVVSGTLAVVYLPETVVERLATTRSEVEDATLGGRLKIWRAGMLVFSERPIIGYGLASFKTAVTSVMGPAAQVAHNSFISVLVETGLVGFLLYVGMIAAVLASIFKLPLVERRFGLVLFATLFLAMTPLTWEDRKAVWFTLALLVGLSQAWLAAGRGAGGVWMTAAPSLRAGAPEPGRVSRRTTAGGAGLRGRGR